MPKVTVVIPTYNEAKLIERKLENVYEQDYPRDRLEVIVVDSASTDGTPELVRRWAEEHPDLNLRLIEEPERRGLVPALNYVLQHCGISGEIVIFTDADAFWEADALRNVVKYFADSSVGAVTASIVPVSVAKDFLEEAYRSYYNLLRVAESKIFGTPVHNGALVAFRTSLLYEMGGLPVYTGNNDSTPASIMAFMGYRAVQIDDVVVREPVREGQFRRKVRRAQHLILHFLKTKRYSKRLGLYKFVRPFERIWRVEWWLHIINPWLLVASLVIFVVSAFHGSVLALVLLGIGLALLMLKPYRTWMLQQIYLVIAMVRNLWTKEIVWSS